MCIRDSNIVDEKGHSALGAVFFFVRPMSVPDDVQEKGSKLNGYMAVSYTHLKMPFQKRATSPRINRDIC